RGGGGAILSRVAPSSSHRITPLPNPPPQGGREHTECGERERTEFAALICSNNRLYPSSRNAFRNRRTMRLPLSGLLVVSLEQAVAAPMCTCRLADAGARVIKVERPEGDFARYYDKLAVSRAAMAATLAATTSEPAAASSPLPLAGEGQGGGMQKGSRVQAPPLPNPPPPGAPRDAPRRGDPVAGEGVYRVRGEGAHRASGAEEKGESAYFVWLNRGKESLVLDLARADDKALLAAILAKADVFVQNLKPGAIAKLGFALEELRRAHPRLVICSISGCGEDGPYAARKAYDMLVQAESGLASVTGGPEAPARVGVSVCDIAAGMNAYEAILAALFSRAKTGDGAAISISMFDAMAEW